MSDMKKRLSKMNSAWGKTDTGFEDVPAGEYEGQVSNALIKPTQSGNLRVSVSYVIADGDHEGESVWDGFMIEKDGMPFEMGMRFLKMWIEKLGYEVPDLDELEDTLQTIAEDAPLCAFRVTKKDGYTNVRLTDVLSEPPERDEEEEGEDDVEEEDVEEEEVEEEEEDLGDEEDRLALIALAAGFGLTDEVSEDSSVADIVAILSESEIDGEDLTDEEKGLLDKLGVKYTKPAVKKTKKKAAKKKATRKK